MWHEYADQRRGLCVHLRSDGNSPFGAAQRIKYQDERPELPVPFGDLGDNDIAAVALLTKTRRWEREQEYRLVHYPDIDYSDLGLRFEGQHCYFLPEYLTGITVGTKMPEGAVKSVLEIARRHDPPLPVYRPQPPAER